MVSFDWELFCPCRFGACIRNEVVELGIHSEQNIAVVAIVQPFSQELGTRELKEEVATKKPQLDVTQEKELANFEVHNDVLATVQPSQEIPLLK